MAFNMRGACRRDLVVGLWRLRPLTEELVGLADLTLPFPCATLLSTVDALADVPGSSPRFCE